MSSFLAKLEMDGEVHTVLTCNYEFEKPMDSTSKPQGEIQGGKVFLTVESTGKVSFVEWILAPEKDKSGSIVFYRRDGMSKLMEIKFDKAYCVKLKEEFDAINNQPMKVHMELVARTLMFNHLKYTNNWTLQ